MARGRMLNKIIGVSVKFTALHDDTARLIATWTIAHLDKRGVFYGDPDTVKGYVAPMLSHLTHDRVAGILADMERVGLIERFEAGGRVWQVWPGFAHNQPYLRGEREATEFPDPSGFSRATAGLNPATAGFTPAEVKGREEKGIQEKGSAAAPPSRKIAGFSVVHTAHADERVSAYMDILGQKQITDSNAGDIMARIATEGMHVWRNVLTTWATNCWKPTNFAGLFERYDAEMNSLRVKSMTPAPAYANGNGRATPDKLAEALRMISAKEGNHA